MRRVSVSLVLVAVLVIPRPAAAWGFEGHKYIMAAAIPLLPAEIRPFFEKFKTSVVEHSIDPDLWRTAGWEIESSRHYVDMDAYGPYPFSNLPHDYDDVVKRYGREFVENNGTLPWRTEEMYRKLVEAFAQKGSYSRENIKFFSAVVAHYTADAHVPFHAALNHDGQLTGQTGLHSRFETELFERYRTRLTVTPGRVVPIKSTREFIFATLTESFTFVQPILDADKAAVARRELYDDQYFDAFSAKVRPILEKRLAMAVTGVASLITAAWVEAGRPPVPLEAPLTPRRVRR